MYDDCSKIPRKNPRDNTVSNPIRRKPCSSTSPLSLRERKRTSSLPRQPLNNGNRNAPANQALPNELRLALQGPRSLCLADTSWSTQISIFASAHLPPPFLPCIAGTPSHSIPSPPTRAIKLDSVPVMATYERGQGVSVSEVGLGDKLG